MKSITTTDLSKFGSIEREYAIELLQAWNEQGLPSEFDDDEVILMFNHTSGHVFLTNSEYQVVMLNGNQLEMWYTCPICGWEGFLEDMDHGEDDVECTEYLKEIKGENQNE